MPFTAQHSTARAGFCGESEEDHAASLDLLRSVRFDAAFLFAYSDRERTYAARHYQDDVPPGVKSRRLAELIQAYRAGLAERAAAEVGRTHLVRCGPVRSAGPSMPGVPRCQADAGLRSMVSPSSRLPQVLVEGASRRSQADLAGRTDTFKRAIWPDVPVPATYAPSASSPGAPTSSTAGAAAGPLVRLRPGDYVAVQVESATAGALRCVPLGRATLREFVAVHGGAAG